MESVASVLIPPPSSRQLCADPPTPWHLKLLSMESNHTSWHRSLRHPSGDSEQTHPPLSSDGCYLMGLLTSPSSIGPLATSAALAPAAAMAKEWPSAAQAGQHEHVHYLIKSAPPPSYV
eukprot:192783-Pelagomonas_calceolata.AAC.2